MKHLKTMEIRNEIRSPRSISISVISEGAFCVWTKEEVQNLLGGDADLFIWLYDIRPQGNVEHSKDLHGELKGKVRRGGKEYSIIDYLIIWHASIVRISSDKSIRLKKRLDISN